MIGELFSRRTIVYYNRTVDITSGNCKILIHIEI